MEKIFSLKIPADMSDYSEYRILYKKLYVRILILIGLPIAAFFSLYNLYMSRYLASAIVILMFFTLCFFLYDFIKKSESRESDVLQEIGIRLFLVCFLFYLLVAVGVEQNLSQTLWFLIFPVLIFFSTNIKEALIWTLCNAAILMYFLFTKDWSLSTDVLLGLKMRLILIFGVLACISYVTSFIIRSAIQNLFDNQKRLQDANQQLNYQIEERKQAEAALRANEEKYRLHFENVSDVIYTINTNFEVTSVSPSVEKLLGYRPEDLVGKPFQELGVLSSAYFEKAIQETHRVLEGETITASEYEFIAQDGTRKYGEVSGAPLFHEGEIIAIVSVARDITERKRAEEEKEKLEFHLQQSQKLEAIGTLSGGLAYDFNNALTGITGYLDMLEMDFSSDEKIADYAKRMKESTHRMTQLIRKLLAFARGGKYQVEIIPFNDFMKDTLALIRHTIDPSISVYTVLPQDILSIKTDITQLQIALSAILTNASEALEGKGCITITSSNETINDETVRDLPGLKPGAYVRLTIKDDGKGMDVETSVRIFEPFFTTKKQGRGLGMAVAYGIIRNHDGWISVVSAPGKGTAVHIYLPAFTASAREPAKLTVKPVATKGVGTILVIEDNKLVMDMTKAVLEELGYRVLGAETGEEAVDIAKTFHGDIDLAMLDVFLPDMGGKAIYSLIMKARPKLKVIVYSVYPIDGKPQEILDAGAEDFIQKPFDVAELSEKLKRVLEGK